jgi:hypothetical protein
VLERIFFLLFQTAVTVCILIIAANILTFLRESNTLGIYYMPADRFARIRRCFILSVVLLLLQRLVTPVDIGWLGFTLGLGTFISIGYFIAILNRINKDQRWSKGYGPKDFLIACTVVIFLTEVYLVYIGYQAMQTRVILGSIL